MVYKSSKLSKSSVRKMAIRHGVIFWVLMVAVYYLMAMAESGQRIAEENLWVIIALVLPALALAVLGMRRMLKYRGRYENAFFTLTEGGIMLEVEKDAVRMFTPWTQVSMVRRSGNVVNLFLKNGRAMPCFLEGVGEARLREFFRFALLHAGKGDAAALTPPPAAAMVGEPLRYSATKSQRREVSDAIAISDSPRRVRVFRPLVLLVWVGIFAHSCYEAHFVMMGVSLLFLIYTAYYMWKPGAYHARLHDGSGADVYVDGDSYLAVRDNGQWLYARNVRVVVAAKLNYSDFYAFEQGGYLALDQGQPHPESWPEVCGKLPRRRAGWTMTMAVLVSLMLGALAFSYSTQYHLYNAVNSAEPQRHILALAGESPESGVKVIGMRHQFANPRTLTLKEEDSPFAVEIALEYPDGSRKYIDLDARGRILWFDRVRIIGDGSGVLHLDDEGKVIEEDIYGDDEE